MIHGKAPEKGQEMENNISSFQALLPIITLILIMVGLIAGCALPPVIQVSSPSPSPTPVKPVRIGILLPLTGPDAPSGESFRNAFDLVFDPEQEENINGHPVEIILEDEGGRNPTLALEKARKLVQYDKSGVIVGPFHGASALAVLNYTSSVPIVNLRWSEPVANKTELGNKYAFWTTPLYQDYTYPLGVYTYYKGVTSITIMGINEPLALDYAEGFKSAFKAVGGKIVQEQWLSPQETQFGNYLANLFPAKGLVLIVPGEKAKTALFKEYARLGLNKRYPVFLAEPRSLSRSASQEIGDVLIGVTAIEGYLPESDYPQNIAYRNAYQQKYKTEPPEEAYKAFNCARILREALISTGGNTDADILKAALLKLEVDLPTGPFRFSRGRIGMQTLRVREIVKHEEELDWETRMEYTLFETRQETYP